MARQVTTFDWSQTTLGDPDGWPETLCAVLSVMFGSTQPMFVTWGPDREFLYNDALAELLGTDHPGALGRPYFRTWPKHRETLAPVFDRAFAGSPSRLSDAHVTHGGDGRPELFLDFSCTPLRDRDGSVLGIFCVCQDTTEERNALQALRESEARFRAVFEATNIGALQAEFDTAKTLRVNETLVRLTGFSAQQLEGKLFFDLVHEADRATIERLWPRLDGSQGLDSQREIRIVRKDGTHLWALTSFSRVHQYVGLGGLAVLMLFDVTDRKQAELALEEAARRKDEYIAMLGHELRNPLAAMRAAIDLLKLTDSNGGHTQRAQDVIDRQSAHMAKLVEGLLDVSRLGRGKLRVHPQPLDLRSVIDAAVQGRSDELMRRGLELHRQTPSHPVWTSGDSVRLLQVFDNLLSNAIRFTDPPGHIDVALEQTDGRALVRVRDTGIGIRDSLLERIFEPFVQETQDEARAAGGLGLGLALARGLVELHEGSLVAYSEGPGRGTELDVELPLTDAPPKADRLPQHDAWEPRRLLLVEDNPDTAEMLKDLLELRGHRVHVASDGPEALEILRNHQIDEILCDLGLPGMSGYELARRIRAEDELHHVPLVALTGYGQTEDRQRTAEAGFDAHLVKPVDILSLEQALASAAHHRH